MVDLIVLSPHLDDAVLSRGGTIARAVEEGRSVEVISFFTDAPPPERVPESLRVFADYETRRAEDVAALECLGASHRWVGLVERAFREPHLTSLAQVFRTPASVDDFPNLQRMQQVIEDCLCADPGVRVLAPLAVGHHVDHVEVFVAATRAMVAANAWDRLSFYEDPYALGRALRRQHFVTRTRSWGPMAGPDAASLRFWGMLRFMAFARRGPGADTYLPPRVRAATWSIERVPITPEHARRKLEAIECYPSQVEALGGLGAWSRALARYHAYWGDAEPSWISRPETPAA